MRPGGSRGARRPRDRHDVEELPTHGGSLRVFLRRRTAGSPGSAVEDLLEREWAGGYADLAGYAGFEERVREAKRALLTFLSEARRSGQSIAGYGAPN